MMTCKIIVLPIKLYPLKKSIFFLYPKNDSNVHDFVSVKLKLTLSTNSSTRIIYKDKARVIWTLISAVMSSLLYQLSYNLFIIIIFNINYTRIKDLHQYILIMSQLCFYYINPQNIIASVGIEPTHVMMKTLCLNHLTIRPIKINEKK